MSLDGQTELRFRVEGRPAPQGSKTMRDGRPVESNPRSRAWRDCVRTAAESASFITGWTAPSLTTAVEVEVVFQFARPRTVSARSVPTTRSTGDIDKLVRCVLDALTQGGVLRDDSQVTSLRTRKVYFAPGTQEGATISVRRVD